ncbi:hypothetical protein CFC21_101615 [Triticum aestivum]|uniref:Pentatricopeptide repeat-containing protein n=2 Tax=Triticum aestivum TaxID=4565 RepID=A0A9R1M3I6_WHEAT|nr:hypothetical protein CFC21_101615 [Triticum aestivum]
MEQAAGPLLPRRPAQPSPQAVRLDARAGRRLLQHPHRAALPLACLPAHAKRWPEARRDHPLRAPRAALRRGLRPAGARPRGALERVRRDRPGARLRAVRGRPGERVRGGRRVGRRVLERHGRRPWMGGAGGVVADGSTLASVLKACACVEDLGLGAQLHACACKAGSDSETAVCNALITMYLKCGGGMRSAAAAFDGVSEPNVITWTALIAGLAQNGLVAEAVSFHKEMVETGDRENGHCFASVLSASGALPSLEHGKMVHCRVMNLGFCSDTVVGNALVNMYFKCGSSSDGRFVFRTMRVRDVVSWTAMILGFGRHGEAMNAVLSFREMIHGGFRTDSITFLAVISACRQGGLVDEGLAIFHSMVEDHGVKPRREHCDCVVDLLGHAGRLKEAEELIRAVGLEMDSLARESLLGACGLHGEVELGSGEEVGREGHGTRTMGAWALCFAIQHVC